MSIQKANAKESLEGKFANSSTQPGAACLQPQNPRHAHNNGKKNTISNPTVVGEHVSNTPKIMQKVKKIV
jgi:hypothetical protein